MDALQIETLRMIAENGGEVSVGNDGRFIAGSRLIGSSNSVVKLPAGHMLNPFKRGVVRITNYGLMALKEAGE